MPMQQHDQEKRRVILYESNHTDRVDFTALLNECGLHVLVAHSDQDIFDTLKDIHPAIFLIDLASSEMKSDELIEIIRMASIHHIILVTSDIKDSGLISSSIVSGATNYLSKPVSKQRLLENIEISKLACEKSEIKLSFETHAFRGGYLGFVGESEAIRQVFRQIQNAAITEANVFITGESGTGKDVCAQSIHDISSRNQQEMVSLNCGAIAENLMESEIFGHEKGAFTGADKRREGAAQRADGGILFLDEIGEMNYELQSKLLRFVQQGVMSRLGSDEELKVDVRFICATNRDPEDMIKTGLFREDLFYRLNTVQIYMPPLRQRGYDIILIAEKCLLNYSKQEQKRFEGFTEETKMIMLDYHWPGNVRELSNAIHNVVINDDARLVIPSMLSPDILNSVKHKSSGHFENAIKRHSPAQESHDLTLLQAIEQSKKEHLIPLKDFEFKLIKHTLDLCGGNVLKAAQYLQVAPSTIYRKIGGQSQ